MTEAVAGPSGVAATSERAVLHRSERGARLVGALDFALKAMREEAAAPGFAAQIEAAARVERPEPAPASEPAPAPAPAPAAPVVAAPILSVPAPPVVIRAERPFATPAPAVVEERREDGPLDIMRWSRGVAPPDEMAELAARLDADRLKPLAPDVAALARAEGNHMPRDVLEALRQRHLGMIGGGDVR